MLQDCRKAVWMPVSSKAMVVFMMSKFATITNREGSRLLSFMQAVAGQRLHGSHWRPASSAKDSSGA